jgi:hypothetical protein
MQKKIYHLTSIIFILIFFIASCHDMWGDHSLGNNLSLLEGDKKEDRIIVYCSGRSEGACRSGMPVLPTYERHYDKNRYAEYVETATSNKKWVIAKTFQIQNRQENYWIISKDFDIENLDCAKANCDSILQSHVTGPLNLTEFKNKIKALKIELDFLQQ